MFSLASHLPAAWLHLIFNLAGKINNDLICAHKDLICTCIVSMFFFWLSDSVSNLSLGSATTTSAPPPPTGLYLNLI